MNDLFHGNKDVVRIEEAIRMLNEHAPDDGLKPLVAILERLQHDPYDEAIISELTEVWRDLGVLQGVVLTYVPYFFTYIPDDIFGDDLD